MYPTSHTVPLSIYHNNNKNLPYLVPLPINIDVILVKGLTISSWTSNFHRISFFPSLRFVENGCGFGRGTV